MEQPSVPSEAALDGAASGPGFVLGDFWLTQLRRQAGALSGRFIQTGNLADAQAAIDFRARLLSLMTQDHPDTPVELSRLAFIFMQRFEVGGSLADLDKALETQRCALNLPDGGRHKLDIHSVLGIYLQRRFERLGQASDLEEAITYHKYSFLFAADDHEELAIFASNLGGSLASRFALHSGLCDINEAIQCYQLAILTAPDCHPEKPKFLNNLGLALRNRSKRTLDMAGFDEAIKHQQHAMALTSNTLLGHTKFLNDLGVSFKERFERSDNLLDIDAAIDCHQRILSSLPKNHSEVTYAIQSLGAAFESRFERTNDISDLNKAIDHSQQAVLSAPDDNPEKSERLTHLGNMLAGRFKRFGNLNDINEAIECYRRASSISSDNRSMALSNLGFALYERFGRVGDLVDLDGAIEYLDQVANLLPDGNPRKAALLSNLGLAYERRSEHLDSSLDLEKAIGCHQQAILLALQPGEKSGYLNNLGLSLARRFDRSGDPADIDKAIESYKEAIPNVSNGHLRKIGLLDNLGVAYGHRFRYSRQLEDIDQSIHYQEQAISLMYEAHPDRPGMLNNLGVSYGRRFGHSGNLLDVDKAVELQTQAVSLTPDGHLQKPRFLTSLSFSISRRLENLGRTDDAELMLGYLRQAARSRSGPAVIRFANARQWAQMSKSPESSMDAHRTAMSLLPRLVWIGAAANRRYQDVASVGDLATEAAAAAIGAQQYSQALEWLEEGRAIVWGRQLQLRTPLDEIRTADPTLAEKLEAVGKQLETGSSSAVRNSQATENEGSLEETARNHRRSAEEWDRLVAEARQIPGLENFLRPRKVEDLVLAARRGPVVVVNVHLSRCDALVLHPSQPEVTHVPLPLFSLEQATKAQSDWTGSLRSFGMRDRGFRKASVSKPSTMNGTEVLGLLWTTVVEPVLSHLGYLRIQSEESTLPRVTWCTTGPLSFLPIHAAGNYTQPSQPKIFHYVISSYAPTLSTLLSLPKQPNECRGLLAVGQDQTAGLSALPCAVEELEQIKQVAGDLQVTRLVGEEATVDAVLSGMKESSWVHLACHAIQDAENPTRSAFFLHDGRLDLATIAKGPVKEGGLAFLSACQTALGHKELPEEAIHLAAGMIMAGYPSVIATMWSIRDKHAPIIASQVYARLAKDGVPSTDRVAEALHAAVAYLRNEVGEDRFEDWAPFIHMGV